MDQHKIKEDVKSLWKVCFGDGDDFITRFTEYTFENQYIYYLIENEEVVSFLNLIPVSFAGSDRIYTGYYLYGVATDPHYRGKGLSRNLLKNSLSGLEYDFIVTIPASKSLFDFYRAQGFTIPMRRNQKSRSFKSSVPSNSDFEILCSDDDLVLFGELGSEDPSAGFFWSEKHCQYLYTEYERDNCSVLFFQDVRKQKKYVVFKQESESIDILATNMEEDDVLICLKSADLPADITTINFYNSDENSELYGLILWHSNIIPKEIDSSSLHLALD